MDDWQRKGNFSHERETTIGYFATMNNYYWPHHTSFIKIHFTPIITMNCHKSSPFVTGPPDNSKHNELQLQHQNNVNWKLSSHITLNCIVDKCHVQYTAFRYCKRMLHGIHNYAICGILVDGRTSMTETVVAVTYDTWSTLGKWEILDRRILLSRPQWHEGSTVWID